MKCIITGCHVHALWRNEFAYGDLYEIGDAYVLVAIKEPQIPGRYQLQTGWMKAPRGASDRIMLVEGEFFDKRAVLVFHKLRSVMNDAAKRYVFGDKAVKL